MNEDIFAEWLCRQGNHVLRTDSTYWHKAIGPRVYQAFPYHKEILPTEIEINNFIRKNNLLAVRYSSPVIFGNGVISYHVCFMDSVYNLSILSKKARYDVKKGLKYFSVEKISLERLAKEGWELRKETLLRQGRAGAETREWWERLCYSAEGLPGIEAWATMDKGLMVASLLAINCEGCSSVLYQQSRSYFLSKGVNNVLTFVFTKEVKKRDSKAWVFYGLQSLDAPVSVDQFKFRMNYTAKPVLQRVVFHPLIRPFVNKQSHSLIGKLTAFSPKNHLITKLEGMMRFHLEGKKEIKRQSWPTPLKKLKAQIISTQT